MKVLLVLAVVAGGVFLLAKSGTFSFYAYSVSQDATGQTQVHCYAGCNTDVVKEAVTQAGGPRSQVAQDAMTLLTPVRDGKYGNAWARLRRLDARVHSMQSQRGAALFWQMGPALMAAMDSQGAAVLDELRALRMRTPIGARCRNAAMRFVARTQAIMRTLSRSFADRPNWAAIGRFERSLRIAVASYRTEAQPLLAAVSSRNRDQLVYALTRF